MFRAIIVSASALVLFISCSSKPDFEGKFGYSPDKMFPGENVVIMYNPDSTNLAGKENSYY